MPNTNRHYSLLDQCLIQLDQGIRTVFTRATATRGNPAAQQSELPLSTTVQRTSARLMRVNHSGEVSAQALYHAQALTARSPAVKHAMLHAAEEENDHLAWCEQRLQELNSHTSYLNPLWYIGSFSIGVCVGLIGDKWNLGFLAETERQVVKHLQNHQQRLSADDERSHKILQQMEKDEAEHAATAVVTGAAELPSLAKRLMRFCSRVMTKTAYWI